MVFISLTTEETDAKSPLDDRLFQKIKDDLDDLNSRVVAAGAAPFVFEVQGRLQYISEYKRSIAFGLLNKEFIPLSSRFMLKKSGTSALAFDLRKHTSPMTPIQEIAYQYSGVPTSIGRAGSPLSTQSVSRATAQIATQSITHAKAALNIQSIISLGTVYGLGTNLWQFNLNSPLDSDNLVGDSILTSGASAGGNNGTFVMVDIGRGGGNNFVISNASGVAQTTASGTAQPKIMSYNFTNPVDPFFAAGYSALFASHTSGVNNGTKLMYAVNSGGNNIWVKNPTGVTQGGVAGSADTDFWKFGLSSPASSDYAVGETALTASHTSGGNNAAALEIIALNSGGSNLVLYNTAGVAQAGVAGNINTNRWIYSLSADPSSQVSVGDTMYFFGFTNPLNNGLFTIKQVNRGAINNVVVYNPSGVIQASAAGNATTTKKLVKFSSDQSAVYTTDSYIEMADCVSDIYNYYYSTAPFKVLEVNRGGGANFNVVIDSVTGPEQLSPAGYIQLEAKSIFNTPPTLAASLTGLEPDQNIVGTSTDFSTDVIPAQTPIFLYITSMPSGDPRDLTVILL